MLVNNLDQMEKIVEQNKNLRWDGWDVVMYVKSSTAMFGTDGIFLNGQWYKKKTFPLTEAGWNIPKNIGIKNA